MSLADQTLPISESFEKPDWTTATVGSALDNCQPFYFWHSAWNLTDSLQAAASDYAACPFAPNGALECGDNGELFRPNPFDSAGEMPAHMTDRHGGSQLLSRGIVCREEDAFNRDELTVEAQFGMFQIGSSQLGSGTQGTNGTSPQRNARAFPRTDTSGSTSANNVTLGYSGSGNSFGGQSPIDVVNTPGNGDGWKGCAVAARVGGGRPHLVANSGSASSSSSWTFRRVDGYVMAAYPIVNGAALDLRLELWRFTTNTSNEVVPVLLAKQTVPNGSTKLRRDQPYHLRIGVVNAGGNATLTGHIGNYKQDGITAEMQCFKDSVFTTSTITAGPSGDAAINTTTGVVTDSGTNKITAYADKTIGLFCGRDREVDTADTSVGGGTRQIVEGLYRLTARTAASAILYNDLFERAQDYYLQGGGVNVDEIVLGLFSVGPTLMGLFQLDFGARNNWGSGSTKLRRSLLWTDSTTGITSPNDYVTFLYDPDASTTQTQDVPRISWHRRPSTQIYNHHRIVSFVGAADPGTTVAANTFRIGVISRGRATQATQDVMVFYAQYTTTGSGAQNSLTFYISRWHGSYSDSISSSTEDVVASIIIQAPGASIPTGYDIEGGVKRTMGFKVQRYDDGTSPTSSAQYTAYWGGATVTFDTFYQSATQDGTTKVITHPAPSPNTTSGRSEGFVFTSLQPKDVGGVASYTDPRFEDWAEGAMDDDPTTGGGSTIVVAGEGTPTVNLSTVVYVDWTISVDVMRPKYTATFESGHRYASPQFNQSRRVITARADNVPKATYDALVTFYDSRQGITDPFYFDFPIPSSLGSNTLTQIAVAFTSSGLKVRRIAEGAYSVELEMVEVFV